MHWDRLLDAFPGDVGGGSVKAVQPAWWVARAWVAWTVIQDVRGASDAFTNVPWLVVLGILVVVSIQVGRRTWGVDRLLRASVLARLLLVALNVVAVTMLPSAVDQTASRAAENRAWMYADYQDTERAYDTAVTYQGLQACVLKVFDADGKPVRGGYVWDATSQRRLPMKTRMC